MTLSYTPRFRFPVPDFNTSPWQAYMATALNNIDAVVYNALVALNTSEWTVVTVYTSGRIAIDSTTGLFWICLVDHTSGAGTFAADRIAHPSYWSQSSVAPVYVGTWLTATAYSVGDLVQQGNGYYICLLDHVSSVFATDLGNAYWQLRMDFSVVVTAALAAQSAAGAFATAAATAQTGAETAQTAAEVAQAAAVAAKVLAEAAAAIFFPAGTSMLFFQAAAPTGWTKQTTHNDKAIRLVTGTPSTGGSSDFSTVFGKTATDAFTLSQANLPAAVTLATTIAAGEGGHTHVVNNGNGVMGGTGGLVAAGGAGFTTVNVTIDAATLPAMTGTTPLGGSGTSKTAAIDLRVKYVDAIICNKA